MGRCRNNIESDAFDYLVPKTNDRRCPKHGRLNNSSRTGIVNYGTPTCLNKLMIVRPLGYNVNDDVCIHALALLSEYTQVHLIHPSSASALLLDTAPEPYFVALRQWASSRASPSSSISEFCFTAYSALASPAAAVFLAFFFGARNGWVNRALTSSS
jgi:hypothetical protein